VGGRTTSQGYVGSADGVRQRYTGKERDDETGLDYFGVRYYASMQGRFTGVDPMLMDEDRMFDPQRINAYAYARNNPLKFIDPDGANPKEPKVVVNRTDTTYKVQGKTADDAIKDASVKGASRHATGDKLPGETTWKYVFGAGYARGAPQRAKGGGFVTEAKTTDVTITVTVNVDTPEWEDYAAASPEEQQKWDSYSNDLKDHEEGHVEIAVKGATEVGKAVQDTTATGRGRTPQQSINNAKSNIKKAQDQSYNNARDKVRQQSREYDDKTKRGKIPRKEIQ